MKEKEKRESERKKIGGIKGENRRRRRGRGKRKGKTLPRQLQVAGFIPSDATASYVLSVSITAHTEISGKLQVAT